MVVSFTENDITCAFHANDLKNGKAYQKQQRVQGIAFHEGGRTITARVTGTASRPYRVSIDVIPPRNDQRPLVRFETDCTCPVGDDCKHAVAVLFEALALRRQGREDFADASSANPLDGEVKSWLEGVTKAAQPVAGGSDEVVGFVLEVVPMLRAHRVVVSAQILRRLKTGSYGKPRAVQLSTVAMGHGLYSQAADRLIARLLTMDQGERRDGHLPDDPSLREVILRHLLATGRCHWRDMNTPPLTEGETRHGQIVWRPLLNGGQAPVVDTGSPDIIAIPSGVCWYIDTQTSQLGRLETGLPEKIMAALLKAPPVMARQVAALRSALTKALPDLVLPLPGESVTETVIADKPVPCLVLRAAPKPTGQRIWQANSVTLADKAVLRFDYGGTVISPADPRRDFRHVEGPRLIIRQRYQAAEQTALKRLVSLGLVDGGDQEMAPQGRVFSMAAPELWPDFVHQAVPHLEAEGWRIETDQTFRHQVIDARGDWQADITEKEGGWWFSLDLGIEVEGQQVKLLPLLVQLLQTQGARGEALAALSASDHFYVRFDDKTFLALPAARVLPLLATLVELFDTGALSPEGRLDMSLGEATALAELQSTLKLRWLGAERLQKLASRLAGFEAVVQQPVPEGFRAILRPYQQQGLSWLQFLRTYELGGILADDMGLGKTVQTLAHILIEKREGRLDRPCLVVCPTSLVPNWKAEAARFAPDLSMISLQGPDRAAHFGQLGDVDLVLTSYALLQRDEDVLRRCPWHIVILDEAQTIKNPAAKVTLAACRLDARHRLCLTGTPVQNHLGDLWSQFAFLMPGLLGDAKRFARVFRAPIERKGDTARQAVLAHRLKPLILRRTKADVATELPPKTLITRLIELSGPQRDLYETVRLAMHEKVREAVAERGWARSQIIVLDALLKLRQVCCDPSLVKLGTAKQVRVSAKLAYLRDMLPELVEEGRRILIFSQFTAMLDLIEAEIEALGIAYVDLRGNTLDRATPVERFQRGEVPIFCLSLKAGGTGLNLTAADTVIHYDPWWNPAVEAQATDRAHRIGQDKPVFVYKFIAEGTIEQRMLELQERKAALASGVFAPEEGQKASFAAADLELLFKPIES